MKVVFTLSAERQLERLYDYIARQSSEGIAEGYARRVVDYCRKLGKFPLRGTARNDILPGLRTIGFERRITIAFLVSEDTVLIAGIFYGGQDFEERLRK